MEDVYVLSAVRTPIGRFGGALKDHSPVDLAAVVMRASLDRSGLTGDALDLYFFGQVLRAGQGQLVPRQAAFKAGIPDHVDGVATDMVCSSGMMSVMQAATFIRAGEANVILAGGVESMSGAGFYLSSRARWGYKFLAGAPEQVVDVLQYDGLTDPFTGDAMGLQTERLAEERGVQREELDAVAAESHKRAAAATAAGHFANEIVPVEYRVKRDMVELTADEGIRSDTTAESLAGLRTAFKKDGVLTAGNSSQISDGAAALVLASASYVKANGLKPLAKLEASAWAAGEPYKFPEAPIPAVARVLEKTGSSISDYSLVENNEAFAINSLLINQMLGVPMENLNVNGGAIALGHPIGCSGARIIVTLLHAMLNREVERGMASICHGTGGGTAVAFSAA
ncbi:MAG: thiolase family protein [Rhodothermales bacterium]|nr:thiolase family protein [Rhodothermales bacterium]